MAASEAAFSFETQARAGSYRGEDAARVELGVLLARLGATDVEAQRIMLPTTPGDEDAQRLLLRYALDVPLNIAWYEDARLRTFASQRRWRWAVIVLLLAAGAVTSAFVWVKNGDVVTAQVGAVLAGAFAVLQALVNSVDKKAQAGAFWRASSDLKEGLFSFLHAWRGKAFAQGGGLTDDFETAVWQELAAARHITRDEREAYFLTYRSASELLGIVSAPFEMLRGRTAESGALQRQAQQMARSDDSALSQRLDGARQQLIEARAALTALEARRAVLVKAGDPEALAEVDRRLIDARVEVVRCQELVRLVAKAGSTRG